MLRHSEEIQRTYNNGVRITYEIIDYKNIYIHSITSTLKIKCGSGTECLKAFLQEFKNKNIYIFSSCELGTDKDILDKWYESFNFKRINNIPYIPYNVTHVKRAIIL